MTSPTSVDSGQPGGAAPSGGASAPPAVASPQQAPAVDVAASNRALAEMRKALAAKEKELEAFKQQTMTDQEKAVLAARTQGSDEWRGKYLAVARTNAVLQALTAKGVTAPELALGALNLNDIEIDETSGRLADPSALDAKIADVLKRYPMLATTTQAQTYASGTDQRQVSGQNLVTTTKDGKLDPKAENLLRWALGGGSEPT